MSMRSNLLTAFLLGALLTGVTVYWAMKPRQAPPVETARIAAPTPAPDPMVAVPAAIIEEPKPSAAPISIVKKSAVIAAPVSTPTPAQIAEIFPAPAALPAPEPQPVSAQPSFPTPAPIPTPEPRQPRTAVIPAGTLITVRLNETLSSQTTDAGYTFHATLDAPLIVNGLVVAERGEQQEGRVIASDKSGRVSGRARLALELTNLSTSDGQKVEIQTDTFETVADSTAKKDAAKVGVAAGIGAAIGAIVGGGTGAAIGGGIGGAAGTGGILATRGKPVKLTNETRISFRLKEPIQLTEKL
jgi:hypothetical protein